MVINLRTILSGFFTAVFATVLAHFLPALLAVLLAFIGGNISRFIRTSKEELKDTKAIVTDEIIIAIISQLGWVALLI